MIADEPEAIVAIERATGIYGWPCPLHVFIDGTRVGQVPRSATREFPIGPGDHDILVCLRVHNAEQTAEHRVRVRKFDRVELICTTNQLPLHPWYKKSLWCLMGFFVAACVGRFVPAIRKLVETHLVFEFVFILCFGFVGMIVWLRQSYKAGAWQPAIFLEPKPLDYEYQTSA